MGGQKVIRESGERQLCETTLCVFWRESKVSPSGGMRKC